MTDPQLLEVQEVCRIKGVVYPAGVRFRQLIVTGPPGSGKSTRVRALGGWPDEGYLDLTERRWWHSRVLSLRPREVHLGLPFAGRVAGLALFEPEWLEAEPGLELDVDRIQTPSPGGQFSLGDRRGKFVFEFLLPPADKVFAARQERAYRHTHLVDHDLSLVQVWEQLSICRAVAWHFHRAGIPVVVRDDFDSVPKVFASGPDAFSRSREAEKSAPPLTQRLLDKFTRTEEIPLVDQFDHVRLAGSRARIPASRLPIELEVGEQCVRIQAERSLATGAIDPEGSILLFDPGEYAERVCGFVRLLPGERVRIGSGEQEYPISLRLPQDILPRFEIIHEGARLVLTDLHSPTGTVVTELGEGEEGERLDRDRQRALQRVREIFGGPIRRLDTAEAMANIRAAIALLEESRFRPRAADGRPGGVVELPAATTPVIIGDLHANLDNLLTILSSGRLLDWVERGQATLLFLGDAVHSEEEDRLEEMDDSILIMDLVLRLLVAFPDQVVYLRGNHDSFSHEVSKEGIPQGHIWRQRNEELRGTEYCREMERLYDLLPYLALSGDFIACHAGPPREAVSRESLINIRQHPRLQHQVTWNRLKSPSKPAGYTRRDVSALRKAFDMSSSTAVIVSHNPPRDDVNCVWLDLGGIEQHHLVHSADTEWVAVLTRLGDRFFPVVLRAEPLLRTALTAG